MLLFYVSFGNILDKLGKNLASKSWFLYDTLSGVLLNNNNISKI